MEEDHSRSMTDGLKQGPQAGRKSSSDHALVIYDDVEEWKVKVRNHDLIDEVEPYPGEDIHWGDKMGIDIILMRGNFEPNNDSS